MPTVRLPDAQPWSLAETMAREKDAFGFYFSAHPVSRYAALTDGVRARTFAELCEGTPAPPGERRPAVMAALIESAKWQMSQRGNRYIQIQLSDRSGQFRASCFDDAACATLELLADAGGCALLQVELDWREGDETPRVAIRSAQSLDEVMARRPLLLEIAVDHADTVAALAPIVAELPDQGMGDVHIMVHDNIGEQPVARIAVAARRRLDQEVVHRLERTGGVMSVGLRMRMQSVGRD